MPKLTGISGDLKTGFKMVEARLNKELDAIKGRTTKGLLLSAIEIRRDMETTPPLIPVDFGNLRASSYIITKNNVSPTIKSLEIKGGNFDSSTPKDILIKLKEQHPTTLAEMREELNKYPIGVAMGFTAFYAAAVHEMGASGATAGRVINWQRPGSGSKFFQAALYRNIGTVKSIVSANARVRP